MVKGFAAGWVLVAIVILVTAAAGVYYVNHKPSLSSPVSSFEECKQSPGSKLQMSYPGVCFTADGQRFVEQVDQSKLKPPVTASPSANPK